MDNKEIFILVVDDDEPMRRLMAEYLSFHYACVSAANADEATRLIETSFFNLVITDTRMPGASGLELCQLVRRMHPETVVLLMLETIDLQWATEAMRQGAYDCLMKPLDFVKALASVDRALRYQAIVGKPRLPQPIANTMDVSNDICFDISSSAPTTTRTQGVSSCSDSSLGYGKALTLKSGYSDRRTAERVPYLCEVECEGLSIGRFTTRINDLSTGGVFIDSMTCLPAGSVLKLRFNVRSTEIIVIGEVRYSMTGIGMGIRFLDIRPQNLAVIENVVKDISKMSLHHYTTPSMAHSAAI